MQGVTLIGGWLDQLAATGTPDFHKLCKNKVKPRMPKLKTKRTIVEITEADVAVAKKLNGMISNYSFRSPLSIAMSRTVRLRLGIGSSFAYLIGDSIGVEYGKFYNANYERDLNYVNLYHFLSTPFKTGSVELMLPYSVDEWEGA